MLGAIAGDIIGSIYEYNPIKSKDFPLFSGKSHFTDDTVLTVAIASAILQGGNYLRAVWEMGRRYPTADYGGSFKLWLSSDNPLPYNSWGNGSAMRVSPVGWAFNDFETIMSEAARSARISHNHPEGIKGAQATALSIYLARMSSSKSKIREEIIRHFGYNLERNIDKIRPEYTFNESCAGTVPEAIISFLESDSYEDAVRNAVSLGGDSDTLACIAGGIAEAYYGPLEAKILERVFVLLDGDLIETILQFYERFQPEMYRWDGSIE